MGWLSGFLYRKSITLSRASGAVTLYQMKLLVGESAGAVGENVDCNSHVQTDFDDLRFTTSDGQTLLDYWIESIIGTAPNQLARVWIEFDSIGTGDTTFYMYYGKVDASAYSNGGNTFIFFDDFERGSNGDGIGGSWTVAAGVATISTDHAFGGSRCAKIAYNGTVCYIAQPADANKAAMMRAWKEDLTQYMTLILGEAAAYSARLEGNSSEDILYQGATRIDTGSNMVADQWGLWEFVNLNTTNHKFTGKFNESVVVNDLAMSSAAFGALGLYNTDTVAGHDFYIDNVIIRNYRSTEPVWGSWGSEEQESQSWEYAGNISFSLTPSGTYFANYPDYNGAITASLIPGSTYFLDAPPYNGLILLEPLNSATYFLDAPPYSGAMLMELIPNSTYHHVEVWSYGGDVLLILLPAASYSPHWIFSGTVLLELIPNSTYFANYEYDGIGLFSLTPGAAYTWDHPAYSGAVDFALAPSGIYYLDAPPYSGAIILELLPASAYEHVQPAGQWQYSGDVSLSLTTSSTCFANYEYDGISLLTLTPGATYTHHFSFSGTITTSLIPASVYFLDHPPYSGAMLLDLVPVSIYGWDHPPYNGAIFVSLLPASPSFANYVFSGVLLFDLIPNSAYQFDEGGFSWNGNVFISPLPSSSYAPAFAFLGGIGISLNPLADYLHVPSLLIFIYDGQVITSLFVSAETELWRTILVPASSIYGYERIEERPVEGLPEDGYIYLQEMIK